MQFLSISKDTTYEELAERVGASNIDDILKLNNLDRTPNVGEALYSVCSEAESSDITITNQMKQSILNGLTTDSDVFETVALLDDNGYKCYSITGTIPYTLKIPTTLTLPDSQDIIGDNIRVSNTVYQSCMNTLSNDEDIDSTIFSEYTSYTGSTISSNKSIYDTYGTSTTRTTANRSTDTSSSSNSSGGSGVSSNSVPWNLPWGKITLYSSISATSMDFPCYPETLDDSYSANYDTMPDMLYQYEPWYLYKSTSHSAKTYKFDIHRDMFSSMDHQDNDCFKLINFCKANLYANYNGSLVQTPTVTMYINGEIDISGIMTQVAVNWDGPIGLDGYYLHCDLSITISEVSPDAINYTYLMNKSAGGNRP